MYDDNLTLEELHKLQQLFSSAEAKEGGDEREILISYITWL